jgi:hypothetical protein
MSCCTSTTSLFEQPLAGNFITSADGIKMPLFTKDPKDVKDYGFDWSEHLAPDDTIIAVSFDTGNTALTVLSSNFDDTNTYVWLMRGVVTVTYLVVMVITTSKGRQEKRTFGIQCGSN